LIPSNSSRMLTSLLMARIWSRRVKVAVVSPEKGYPHLCTPLDKSFSPHFFSSCLTPCWYRLGLPR
jgi:hypothetical protein